MQKDEKTPLDSEALAAKYMVIVRKYLEDPELRSSFFFIFIFPLLLVLEFVGHDDVMD